MKLSQLNNEGYSVIAGNSVSDPIEVSRLNGARHLLLLKKDDKKFLTWSNTDINGEFSEPRLI